MHKNNFDNISVVVQGPVLPITKYCLKSIRKFLPNAEIILSTWNNSYIMDLDYDKIVLNDEPEILGDMYLKNNPYNWSKPNNMNKQIVSSFNGLKAATKEYALKFRTDFLLQSNQFIYDYFDILKVTPKRNKKWSIFKQRILTIGTGNAQEVGLLYHMSDFIAFGLKEDILELWNIPLIDKYYAQYCATNNLNDDIHYFRFRYAAEQKLLLDNLDKYNISYKKPEVYFDKDDLMLEESNQALINNLIFYDYAKSKIFTKFEYLANPLDKFSYKFDNYINMYEKYLGKIEDSKTLEKLKKCKKNIFKKVLNTSIRYGIKRLFTINKQIFLDCFVYSFYIFSKRFCVVFKNDFEQNSYKIICGNFKYEHIVCRNNSIERIQTNIFNKYNGLFLKIQGSNNTILIGRNTNLENLKIEIIGNGNVINIEDNQDIIKDSKIIIHGKSNELTINKNTHAIINTIFYMPNFYHSRKINIGENAMIMGAELYCEEDCNEIVIGKNLTCSDHVTIQNSDGHVIFDENNKIINGHKNGIIIGDNVWLGRKSTILKDCRIPTGSIVSSGSVVTKKFNEKNIILAGVPAVKKKSNVNWTRNMFNQFIDTVGGLAWKE